VDQNAGPLARVHEFLALYGGTQTSVAHVLCDGHQADAVGYTVVEPDLTYRELTYGQLRSLSERFAAALSALGVGPGDRVATLMGKSADYLVTLLGIWRLGAVHVPLFTAFAPPAIALRLRGSAAKVVVCDEAQRPKLTGEEMPADAPWSVIVSGSATHPGDVAFADLMARHEPGLPAAALGGDAPIVHIYTSGTTGQPGCGRPDHRACRIPGLRGVRPASEWTSSTGARPTRAGPTGSTSAFSRR
jgi:acetyl-CoA synthetase